MRANMKQKRRNTMVVVTTTVITLVGVGLLQVQDAQAGEAPQEIVAVQDVPAEDAEPITVPEDELTTTVGGVVKDIVAPPPPPKPVTSTKSDRSGANAQSSNGKSPWPSKERLMEEVNAAGGPLGARWVLTEDYGSYGAADLNDLVVYINPRVPVSKIRDVVLHERAHMVQAHLYGQDMDLAGRETLKVYGGGGRWSGLDREADCIALIWGARWTHYTSCGNSAWRDAARATLQGQRP